MSQAEAVSRIVRRLDKLCEFDREPIAEERLHSGKYFAGCFAGEHVAATEFVIGALFVAWGARPLDILVGLIVGNLMAVLTWALLCAPISVQTRLTLYWYLRKIAGPFTTVIYNILNAILYCILAGCMITVSASAVRIPFRIPVQNKWYPEDLRFVGVVFLVGAVVVTLAILGFKRLSQFASVCAPWMFLMFIAGAVVMLPTLGEEAGTGPVRSFSLFWEMAEKVVWTGVRPDGSEPIGFWHVAAFAWICNLAMHLGLSDMALFRFAKRWSYGFYSAFGMFLGHYLAWICAGIMGAGAAAALHTTIVRLDAGQVAYTALGWAGALAVVIAGWTTSNPTLYRAGLALQVVTPNWPRWLVTLLAGILTTAIACFPFVFTKLLEFVAIYGLLLMPVGAIVVVEHWIFPKIRFTRYWASRKNLPINWPAVGAWMIAVGGAIVAWQTGFIHQFFLFIPVWILTAALYIVFSGMAGAREKGSQEMEEGPAAKKPPAKTSAPPPSPGRRVLQWTAGLIALASLLACLAFSMRVFVAGMEGYGEHLASMKDLLIPATLIYFVSGTVWIVEREKRTPPG